MSKLGGTRRRSRFPPHRALTWPRLVCPPLGHIAGVRRTVGRKRPDSRRGIVLHSALLAIWLEVARCIDPSSRAGAAAHECPAAHQRRDSQGADRTKPGEASDRRPKARGPDQRPLTPHIPQDTPGGGRAEYARRSGCTTAVRAAAPTAGVSLAVRAR